MQDTRYMDAWIHVPLCKKGDKLYHYTTAEGVRGIVENREFLATKSDFLNDKLEFQYAVEVMERLTEKYIVNQELRERFFSKLKKEIDRFGVITPICEGDGDCEMDEMSFYVVAFSKLQNNALLWAEFTDFRGYCLEFDYEKIVEGFQNRVFLHGTVIYDEEEQMNGLLESLLSCIRNLIEEGVTDLEGFFEEEANPSEESLDKLVTEMSVVCSVYAMFFKKSFFEGEQEYRFIFPPLINSIGTDKPNFRLLDQIFLPYIMVEFEGGKENVPLESVMVGAKNNSDIAVRGMRYFLKTQGLDIPVLLSDIPLRY
ncbi:MAG: DUF2971 domain-containing protein [Bacteroidales bacterium]|nr:DUF2971 domain-containing protein [Bacteroidales bacterium]